MKKTLMISGLIVYLSSVLIGQNNTSSWIHFNQSFYLAGDIAWFTVYLPEAVNDNAILYAELWGKESNTQPILQVKLPCKNSQASGYLRLPLDLKEGFYSFRAYLGLGAIAAYTHQLTVYNEFTDPEQTLITQGEEITINDHSNDLAVNISTSKDVYKAREEVALMISTADPSLITSDLSISIVDAHLWSNQNKEQQSWPLNATVSAEPLYLKGRYISRKTRKGITTRFLVAHIVGTDFFTFLPTDEHGFFGVELPLIEDRQVVQIINFNPYESSEGQVELQTMANEAIPQTNGGLPERTPAIRKYLSLSQQTRKLREVFNLPATLSPPEMVIPPFSFTSLKDYDIDSYTNLVDVGEFISEVILTTRVNKLDDGQRSIRLFNQDTKHHFNDKPWYLVDGYLTQNEEVVLNIPMEDVIDIQLFASAATIDEQFGKMFRRNGLLLITTEDGQAPEEIKKERWNHEFYGIQRPVKAVSLPDNDERIPLLNASVFWSSDVKMENGKATLNIPMGDAPGTYRVIVSGKKSDGGIIKEMTTFELEY
jgi:hypothetical protein